MSGNLRKTDYVLCLGNPCGYAPLFFFLRFRELHEFYLRFGVLEDFAVPTVDGYYLVEFGETLVAVENESSHGLVVVAFWQSEAECLVYAFYLKAC